ncbi:hypothetical protein [Allomesorhizobium camelthorni]
MRGKSAWDVSQILAICKRR